MALMDRAAQANKNAPTFKRPTVPVSPDMRDAVDRVVAAGMKMMYAPEMKDERDKVLAMTDPVALVLAQTVTGLTLVLDRKSQGGIPMPALFPAAIELLADLADLFVKAGKPVSQDDFNDAARTTFVLIGKKLGVSDEDMMAGAQQAAGGGEQGGAEGGDVEDAADAQDPNEQQEPAEGEPPEHQPEQAGEPVDQPGAPEEPDPAAQMMQRGR